MQPGVEQSKDALLQEVRKRQLTNEDFKESPTNRDPFRSFLTTFATQVINVKPQHRILLEKFALEELKLIAIVGGNGTSPKAMFVDPTFFFSSGRRHTSCSRDWSSDVCSSDLSSSPPRRCGPGLGDADDASRPGAQRRGGLELH